ncbi:MAG: hypothetical protein PVF66_00700 [Candidatus Aminicenantes bacterium]
MLKIKRKIDKAVAGQIRKFLSTFDKEDMKPIPEDQKVEVVHMKVRTKEEFETLKTRLEEQGYQLTCEEFYEEGVDDSNFSATILGEKRIQLEEKILHPRLDPKKERKKDLIVTIGVKSMWWLIFIGILWLWFYIINTPLNLAIRDALRFWFQ